MGRDHWDAILASAPLNATAGAVTSRSGVQGPQGAKVTTAEWDAPPPYVKFQAASQNVNLLGHRFGRLTVTGYLGEGKWCCRCTCGTYVSRRQKAALNPANAETDRCTQCRHTAFLARSASGEHARIRAESEKARKW
jgi:hypothetical protein